MKTKKSFKVNWNLMVYIFGEQLGSHYWDKFNREHDRNIMRLMKGMDSENKGDLMANIFFVFKLLLNKFLKI